MDDDKPFFLKPNFIEARCCHLGWDLPPEIAKIWRRRMNEAGDRLIAIILSGSEDVVVAKKIDCIRWLKFDVEQKKAAAFKDASDKHRKIDEALSAVEQRATATANMAHLVFRSHRSFIRTRRGTTPKSRLSFVNLTTTQILNLEEAVAWLEKRNAVNPSQVVAKPRVALG